MDGKYGVKREGIVNIRTLTCLDILEYHCSAIPKARRVKLHSQQQFYKCVLRLLENSTIIEEKKSESYRDNQTLII